MGTDTPTALKSVHEHAESRDFWSLIQLILQLILIL